MSFLHSENPNGNAGAGSVINAPDLRNSVIGETCDAFNVAELAERLSFEASPQIRDEYLGPLVETD